MKFKGKWLINTQLYSAVLYNVNRPIVKMKVKKWKWEHFQTLI